MYRDWPCFNAVIQNVQLDIAKVDMDIARLYSSLVEDQTLRETIFGQITAEHERTRTLLPKILDQADLLDAAPMIKRSIERRNPYIDPINFIRVSLLRDFRQLEPDTGDFNTVLEFRQFAPRTASAQPHAAARVAAQSGSPKWESKSVAALKTSHSC